MQLAGQGNPWPTSTLITRKPKAGKRTDTGPDRATVDVVLERDGYGCSVCANALYGPRGSAWSIHHRVRRGQHVDNRPSNLISVCGGADVPGCHQEIHSHPVQAREAGWLLRGTDEPAQSVMAHALYGFVLLGDDGRVSHSRKDAAA